MAGKAKRNARTSSGAERKAKSRNATADWRASTRDKVRSWNPGAVSNAKATSQGGTRSSAWLATASNDKPRVSGSGVPAKAEVLPRENKAMKGIVAVQPPQRTGGTRPVSHGEANDARRQSNASAQFPSSRTVKPRSRPTKKSGGSKRMKKMR
jgi:hypothetical protein